MRHLKSILILAVLGMSTGCVKIASVHPLFSDTAREVVFDPVLLGKWQGEDTDKSIFEVTRLDKTGYAVAFEMDGKPLKATFHLLKSRGLSLLDAIYTDNRGPEHMFLKIRIEPDTLWVATADSTWLRERIVASGKPRYTVVDEDLLLTASSSELRKALLPYLAKPEAFDDEGELKRVK